MPPSGYRQVSVVWVQSFSEKFTAFWEDGLMQSCYSEKKKSKSDKKKNPTNVK